MSEYLKSCTVVLPLRKGSQRIVNKNIKPIGKYQYGLTEIKLQQLVSCEYFSEILIDTDYELIEEILDRLGLLGNKKIRIEKRPEELASSSTTTDELINYILTKIKSEHFVWTHVTSPFFTEDCYNRFMLDFLALSSEKDSLVAVNPLREFIWSKNKPLNYDRHLLRWPFTQTLEPIFLINSAAFAIETAMARRYKDRMGESPAFFECSGFEGFDVDWEDQFKMVEVLINSGYLII
jgi:CMP-N-acetylneuraminic acid synthetase